MSLRGEYLLVLALHMGCLLYGILQLGYAFGLLSPFRATHRAATSSSHIAQAMSLM